MSHGIFRAPAPINEPVKTYAPAAPERTQVQDVLKELSKKIVDIPLRIGSQSGIGKDSFEVRCPHDHQKILARVQAATHEDVQNAVKAANRARPDWAALPWHERVSVFLKAADLMATKYRVLMNAATMLGQGKSIHQAEIDAACELIDFFRFNAHYVQKIYEQQPASAPGTWNRSEVRGLEGFVFAVTPFNFTAIAVNLPTAPAMMGCSVIWKPASTSMLACHFAFEILHEAGLPEGVINLVAGDHDIIGSHLIDHPDLSGLHFTGSSGTFNYLWKRIGNQIDKYRQFPRIVGETGGKDFVFAHPSANVDEVSVALIRGAFEYQGQKCSAASRAYLPKSLWPQIKERIVAMAEDIALGSPEDFKNFMGAVIDQRAFTKIKGYIDQARASSEAEIIAGGQCDDSQGYFIRPTIIEARTPRYASMVEEIFGPVLSVFVYEDQKIEETIDEIDQATAYALTGAIFARDRQVIHHLTQRLEHAAGNFYINDKPTGAVVGQQPFGGARASGTNDKAGSIYNLLRWASMRTVKENFIPVTDYRYPFMN